MPIGRKQVMKSGYCRAGHPAFDLSGNWVCLCVVPLEQRSKACGGTSIGANPVQADNTYNRWNTEKSCGHK